MIVMASPPELALADRRAVHELCWAFEIAWRSGESPSVEHWAQKLSLDSELLLAELRATERELLSELTYGGSPRGDSTSEHEHEHEHEYEYEYEYEYEQEYEHEQEYFSVSVPYAGERYDFIQEIARGGAGSIWRVFDRHLKRELAVKLLLNSQDNAEMRRRLEQEARLSGCLHHPGIVPVYELGRLQDGRPFISMKLIEGQNLAELLKSETSSGDSHATRKKKLRDRWLPLFLQVCETVAYAHDQGIVHRDLKPSNIMVGRFGEVQVMDWGLGKMLGAAQVTPQSGRANPSAGPLPDDSFSKAFNETFNETFSRAVCDAFNGIFNEPGDALHSACAPNVDRQEPAHDTETRIGAVLGTLSYMSPEQARGDNHLVDQRSDVFALGGILCRLLTGSTPFPTQVQDCGHDSQASRKVVAALRATDMQRTRESISQARVDKRLIQLTLACLAEDPQERPATAAEVAEQVRQVLAPSQRRANLLASVALLLMMAVVAIHGYRVIVIQDSRPSGNEVAVLKTSFDVLVKSGNTAAAEQLARTAIQTTDDVQLKIRLACLLRCRELYVESEDLFRSALASEPNNSDAALELARLLTLTDRTEDARQILTFALEHNPRLAAVNEEFHEVLLLASEP